MAYINQNGELINSEMITCFDGTVCHIDDAVYVESINHFAQYEQVIAGENGYELLPELMGALRNDKNFVACEKAVKGLNEKLAQLKKLNDHDLFLEAHKQRDEAMKKLAQSVANVMPKHLNRSKPLHKGENTMNTFEYIKSAVASEIYQLPSISFDHSQDNEQALLDHIEANGYCQPSEIGTTAEAYDIVWGDLARNTDYEMPDFSNCKSSLECIEAEGQAILTGAYYEATQEIVKEIASTIDECFGYDFGNLELSEMFIGKSGLGHIPHDYEADIADSSMCVWVKSKKIEITVSGVTLYGTLEQSNDE